MCKLFWAALAKSKCQPHFLKGKEKKFLLWLNLLQIFHIFPFLISEENQIQQPTNQEQDKLLWAYVQTSPETVQELSADAIPRVKLTGEYLYIIC